jgi:hypothetical protein
MAGTQSSLKAFNLSDTGNVALIIGNLTMLSVFSLLFDDFTAVKMFLWKSKNESRCRLWTAAYIPSTLAWPLHLARTKIHHTCDVPTHLWHAPGPTLTLSSNLVDQCLLDSANNDQATNQTWSSCVGLCKYEYIAHGQRKDAGEYKGTRAIAGCLDGRCGSTFPGSL